MRHVLAATVVALAFASPVAAQVPMYGPGGPLWGYPPLYGGPCAAPCPDAREARRELRRQSQERESDAAAKQSMPPPREPPPPTRVEEIRPEYEAASQIRDEYRRSGERR
jgi:hypothetical protein